MRALKADKLAEEVRKLKASNDARAERLQAHLREVAMETATSILRRARGGLMGLLPDRIATASIGKSAEDIAAIVRREVEQVLADALGGERAL